MNLRAELTSNVGLKLLSILFALGIWNVVRGDLDESFTPDLTIQVKCTNSDISAKLDEPESARIAVEFNGPKRQIQDLRDRAAEQLVAVARVGPDDLTDKWRGTLFRSVEELSFPFLSGLPGVTAKSSTPEKIKITATRLERLRIVVEEPKLLGANEIPNAVVRVLGFPETVLVQGPAQTLENLPPVKPHISTDALIRLRDRLGNQTTQAFPQVQLELPDDWDPALTLVERDKFQAKIEVTSELEQMVWVPIHIDYRGGVAAAVSELRFLHNAAGSENWREPLEDGTPATVRLPFSGPPRQMESLDATRITAFVLANDVRPEDGGFANLKVHVQMRDVPRGVAPVYGKFPLIGVEAAR